jgi:hypothetical protein
VCLCVCVEALLLAHQLTPEHIATMKSALFNELYSLSKGAVWLQDEIGSTKKSKSAREKRHRQGTPPTELHSLYQHSASLSTLASYQMAIKTSRVATTLVCGRAWRAKRYSHFSLPALLCPGNTN